MGPQLNPTASGTIWERSRSRPARVKRLPILRDDSSGANLSTSEEKNGVGADAPTLTAYCSVVGATSASERQQAQRWVMVAAAKQKLRLRLGPKPQRLTACRTLCAPCAESLTNLEDRQNVNQGAPRDSCLLFFLFLFCQLPKSDAGRAPSARLTLCSEGGTTQRIRQGTAFAFAGQRSAPTSWF